MFNKRDIRRVMKYLFIKGMKIVDIVEEMSSFFKEDSPKRSQIYEWCSRFKKGDFDVEDKLHTGHPKT